MDKFETLLSYSFGEHDRLIQQFSKIPTTVERVHFVLELLLKYNIGIEHIKDSKNNKKSSDLRIEGNKFYSLKKDEEALEMYTNSIALAEEKSENLGLAYANRSAVLFRLGFYEECIEDIERAFENNYPNDLKPKINERKEKALSLKDEQIKLQYYQPIPSIDDNDRNPLIECASNCVEIKNDSKLGRCVVATRDIEIGEIIAVERPTFSLLENVKWCHCHHCLKLCYNLLPCNSCTKALFCSSECKDNSILYHKYECQILATLESQIDSIGMLLPIRIAISMRHQYGNFGAELKETGMVYKSERYKEIHNLITNEKYRSPKELLILANCTAIIFKILKGHTDFFANSKNFEDIFMELLFQYLQIKISNFHSINELSWNSNGKCSVTEIGIGAYNFMSLFNHSCTPNVSRTEYGTFICMSTVKTIRKGEQLFDNYGFKFFEHQKAERQLSLKERYHFHCNCQACENNWETQLENINDEYSCILYTLANHVQDLHEGNLEIGKRIRPKIIELMKKMEKKQENLPGFSFYFLQSMLVTCNGILGNLRRSLT